jgi:hypothetical protein
MQRSNSHRSSLGSVFMIAACSLVALAGYATGQESNAPLAGPEVKDTPVPGENRKFTGGNKGRGEKVARPLPHRAFVRAFEVLKGDNVDSALRLTSAQEDSLKALDADMKSAQRKYIEEHKQEIDALRAEGGPEVRRRLDAMLGTPPRERPDAGNGATPGEGGKKPKGERPKGDVPMEENMMDSDKGAGETGRPSEELRNKARELFEGAPKPEETHAKMMAVLTDAQKPVVQQEIERLRKEAQSKGGRPGPGAGDRKPQDGQLPERMQERLKNMTPEEREEAIKKYRERRDQGK